MKSSLFRPLVATVLTALAFLSSTAASAQTTRPWLHRTRSGDIVYFAHADRIERYNLATEAWLTSIALSTSPSALWVDAGHIYLGVGRTVYRRALDGSGEQPLYNSPLDIIGIVTDESLIFALSGNTRIDSIRKSDLQYVATQTQSYGINTGISIAPTQRRIFGVNTSLSSFSTHELTYNSDGTFGSSASASSIGGSFSEMPRTVLSEDERTLIRTTGSVYAVPGLASRGNLGGALLDVAFHGADVLIGLRDTRLVAFDNMNLEAGSYTLTSAAQGVEVRLDHVFVFRGDSAAITEVAVEKIAVATITAAEPGAPKDPALYSFVPDETVQMEDGALLVLSKALQSVFKWSPTTRRYTASYPLAGSPKTFTYSPSLRRIYTGYGTGAILQIKLDEGATSETPFAQMSGEVTMLYPMDDMLYCRSGSSYSSGKVLNQDGTETGTAPGGYIGSIVWSSSQRRLYYVDSRLYYAPLDASGVFGAVVGGPYPYSVSLQGPIRLSSDSGLVLGMNGYVFRTSDLDYDSSLSNAVHDAAWRSGTWASIRSAGTDTQVQLWTPELFFERGFTTPGFPLRMYVLPDGKLIVLTTTGGTPDYYSGMRNSGHLIFSIVDPTGEGSVTSSPIVTTQPTNLTGYRGKPASLSVVATGTSLSYQWKKNGADISGATNSTLEFTSIADADAGSYAVVVSSPYGNVGSNVVSVVVQDPPAAPVITTQPRSSYASLGGSMYFSVSASGTLLTYQWRKAGTPIASGTQSTLSLYHIAAEDYTTYDVIVANPGGTVTSNEATLSQYVAPSIITQPVDTTVSAGGNASFSTAASGAPLPPYRWQRRLWGYTNFFNIAEGGGFTGTSTATLTITNVTQAMNGDQYRVVVGYGPSEVYSAAATLGVNGAPKITSRTSATFLVGVPNSFVVTALGTPAPSFSATGLPSWAAIDATTGVISGTPSSTAAAPFSIRIQATNGTLPNDEQVFTLNVQSVEGGPVITSDPANQSIGEGGSTTLSANISGTEPMTYQWTKDGTAIEGATNTTYSITDATMANAGRYRITATNAVGAATSAAALVSVVPAGVGATHRVLGGGYRAGDAVTISTTINYSGAATALGCQVLLPEGWSYISGTGREGDVKPAAGTTSLLEWAWTTETTGPVTFTYTLGTPADENADRQVAALVTIRTGETPVIVLGLPDPLVVLRLTTHSADTDGNNRLSLFELTRVVELYNTRNGTTRTGCYQFDPSGEDGFAPDSARTAAASVVLPAYHSADSNRDGKLSLLELTRVIELYNYRSGTTRTGEYRVQTGTEDGFAPGVVPEMVGGDGA